LFWFIINIRKFAGDGEMVVDGIRLDVGPCHGMALRATDDGIVGTRHGVSPPHGVSPFTPSAGTTTFTIGKKS